MKKISLLIILLALLAGCSHHKVDPYKAYEGKTSSQIFHESEQSLAKKKYEKASKGFEALDALYPFGPYAQQGHLDIIYAYYKNDDTAAGLAAADRYIRLYPQDEHVDYAYYMKGLMSYEESISWFQTTFHMDPAPHDLSDKRESFTAFNQVVRQYPHSIYAPDSMLHMAVIRNMMARKEILLANFYMKRKAYIAAANRATEVLQHYSGSPSVPEALAIMVNAYKGAGLNDLASKSYRILQASYPDSPEYKRVAQDYKI